MFYDVLTMPEYGFLRMAFLLSAAASVTFGLIGALVVVRRIGYLAGAISHCAFGGIGIGLWLKQTILAGGCGFAALAALIAGKEDAPAFLARFSERIDPTHVAALVALLSALAVAAIQKRAREREDALIGLLWSLGMATGLLFLDRTTGYVSISGWLFGDIMLISAADLRTVFALSVAVCLIGFLFFKRLEAVCFDEEFARLRGVNAARYYRLLLLLTAVSVVLMLRVVGMVLVIALLTIPASAASRLTKRLGPMILWSIFFCFIGSWLGIWLSFRLNFSTGPMIIVVVSAIYFLTILFTGRRTV